MKFIILSRAIFAVVPTTTSESLANRSNFDLKSSRFLSKYSRLLFLYFIRSTNLTRETRLIGHKAISQELIMNVEQINEKEANATIITFCLSQFIYLCDL